MHTRGEVSKFHNKTYVVKAGSEQEAQEIARKSFEREFDCINISTETKSYTRTKRAIFACIFMFIAVVISFGTFESKIFFGLIEKKFYIGPSMRSCIMAIAFYCIYVIRFKGIKRSVGSAFDIVFTILSVLLLSSVFQLILADDVKLFGLIPLPGSYTVLIITIAASLLGVKLVSAGCMIFIALAAISNIEIAEKAMAVAGVIYVMCSFVGILLYVSVEPAIIEGIPQIKNSFATAFKIAKNDFSDAKNEAKTIIDKIPK